MSAVLGANLRRSTDPSASPTARARPRAHAPERPSPRAPHWTQPRTFAVPPTHGPPHRGGQPTAPNGTPLGLSHLACVRPAPKCRHAKGRRPRWPVRGPEDPRADLLPRRVRPARAAPRSASTKSWMCTSLSARCDKSRTVLWAFYPMARCSLGRVVVVTRSRPSSPSMTRTKIIHGARIK